MRRYRRILLIEDRQELEQAVADGLSGFGFRVDIFGATEESLAAAKSATYDALILDLGLPDRDGHDGFDLIQALRAAASWLPILVLSTRTSVEDRVDGLDRGADDYLAKPFAVEELAARLRALLRRPGHSLGNTVEIGNITLDTIARQLKVDGKTVSIPPRELEALELLMRRADQVVPKRLFEDSVYGLSEDVAPNTIEAVVSRLRRRLEAIGASPSINTLRGIGYLLRK